MKKLLLLFILLTSVGFLFAGTPHPVYVELYDSGGNHPDSATFQAWIVGRESEVLTETSTGCTYYDSGVYKGLAAIQCGTFPTQWQAGDVLHVEATTSLGDGTGEFTLTNDNYQGFGPIFGNTGIEVSGSTPGQDIDWGDGVTGHVDQGSAVSNVGNDGNVDHRPELEIPDNAGYYFTLTIDDATFPVDVTITLDTQALGYTPYNLAYYYNGSWHYRPGPMDQITWTDPMTDHSTYTFTMSATGKGGAKGDVDVPIVFANGSDVGHTLPVVLAEYYVKQLAEFAQITWTTQSENNMIGYRVWRATVNSLDKANPVSSIINATNETTGHSYNYTDKNVSANNTYYYWLEAQNYDGNTHYYHLGDVTIEDNTPTLPKITNLSAAYPNPFNPETTIKFSVKEGETATLTIFNLKNQVVERRTFNPGEHSFKFDGTKLASGIYFYRLQSPSYTSLKKMTMIK